MKTGLTPEILFEENEIGSKPTNGLVKQLTELFSETVHSVNTSNYTNEQLSIWAPKIINPEKWMDRINNNYLIIAKNGNDPIGFGELTSDGCIDMLYVDKNYLRKKIGQQLLEYITIKAQNEGINEILVESSITARPFFEIQGFNLIKKHVKQLNGRDFIVFIMNKKI